MSYRIAMVRFGVSDKHSYPVNCYRADVKSGQKVVVETPRQQRRFKVALVESVEFKNWDCQNTIICLHSEVVRAEDGTWSFEMHHSGENLLHKVSDLEDRLLSTGWIRTFPKKRSTYRVNYALQTLAGPAEILFRKNGIDFRVPGRRVNHWFYESNEDLLEFCWSFAEEWRMKSVANDDFFRTRGRPHPKPEKAHDAFDDIYRAISGGSGEAAYLGDGVWMSPSGNVWDEGR